MKTRSLVLLLTIIIILLPGCLSDIIEVGDYPRVITGKIKNITGSGAVLTAEIYNPNDIEIIQYGFLFAPDSFNNFDDSEVRYAHQIEKTGFQYEVTTNLNVEETYYVKAFIRTTEKLIIGQLEPFVSKGSSPAEIFDIEKSVVCIGDTVLVRGSGLSMLENENKVTVGGFLNYATPVNDTVCKVIIHDSLLSGTYDMIFSSTDKEVKIEKAFSVLQPSVTGFLPKKGALNNIITIQGENIGTSTSVVSVLLGSLPAEVVSCENQEIKFKVPIDSTGYERLNLFIGRNEFDMGLFRFLSPKIVSYSPGFGTFGDLIKITGSDLDTYADDKKVTMSGISATIVSFAPNNIVFSVPYKLNLKYSTIEVFLANRRVMSFVKKFQADALIIRKPPMETISAKDRLTLFGSGMNPIVSYSKVSLVDRYNQRYEALVAGASDSTITFTVPDIFADGLYDVIVFNGIEEVRLYDVYEGN